MSSRDTWGEYSTGSEKSCSKSSGSVLVNFPQYYLTQKRGNIWFSSSIPWEMVWKHKPTSLHHRVRFTGHQPQCLQRLLSVPSLGQMLRHPKWIVYNEVWKKKSTELNHQENISMQDQVSYTWQLGLLSGTLHGLHWEPRNSLPTTKDTCLLCIYTQRWKLRRHFFCLFQDSVY